MENATPKSAGLRERWIALPRSARWGIGAIAGIALYFGVVEGALENLGTWNVRADKRETDLRKFERQRSERRDTDKAATEAVKVFGEIQGPADSATRSQELNQKVQAALDANGVKRPTTTAREVLVPTNSPLSREFGTDHRVERLVSEIVFDAEPEQVAKVVADLEQVPEIARVSRLMLRQKSGENEGGRQVSATIWVEAWQLKQKGRTK